MTMPMVYGAARLACVLGVTLILSACTAQSTSFYTLSTLKPEADQPDVTLEPAKKTDIAVGIGPVTIPSYLERPEIVLRASDNRMVLTELDNWIEPLESMVPRILADNVAYLLVSDRVFVLPQRRSLSLDYRAEIDVIRFDAASSGNVVLDVQWWIYKSDERRPLRQERTRHVERLPSIAGPADIAAAMSSALGALSQALAEAIKQPAT